MADIISLSAHLSDRLQNQRHINMLAALGEGQARFDYLAVTRALLDQSMHDLGRIRQELRTLVAACEDTGPDGLPGGGDTPA